MNPSPVRPTPPPPPPPKEDYQTPSLVISLNDEDMDTGSESEEDNVEEKSSNIALTLDSALSQMKDEIAKRQRQKGIL